MRDKRICLNCGISVFILLSSCLPFMAFAESDIEKENRYYRVSSKICWNWEESAAPEENAPLAALYQESGIATDPSPLGVIYRALQWECEHWSSSASNVDTPNPISGDDWAYMKSLNPVHYAAVRVGLMTYEIGIPRDVNKNKLFGYIEMLRTLKREMLNEKNSLAVAIVSARIGYYLSFVGVKAIEEYEYAFSHLNSNTTNEQWLWEDAIVREDLMLNLADEYNDVGMHTMALPYAEQLITSTPYEERCPATYNPAIYALVKLRRFDEAFAYASEAYEIAGNNPSYQFVALLLKLSVFTHRQQPIDKEKISLTIDQALALKDKVDFERAEKYIALLRAFHAAINSKRPERFESIVADYIDTVMDDPERKWLNERIEQESLYSKLARVYQLRGDYQTAYEYEQRLKQTIVDFNALESEARASSLIEDPLMQDINIIALRQLEAQQQQQALELQSQKQQFIIVAVLALMLALLAFWFWQCQRIIKRLAEHDSLTGAMTRRAFYSWYDKALSHDSAGCLALIDLDHFKQINDTYGHLTGDEVLTTFTRIVQQRIRKSDKLCRFGGEEFLLILPDVNKTETERLIDDIRQQIKLHTNWTSTDATFSVSFSAGVIEVTRKGELNAIISQCDALLYDAKRNGRSRTESAVFATSL